MRTIDLLSHKFKLDHDPTSQIASDPSAYIEQGVGIFAEVISAIPAMVIDLVTSILTDPGQLADLLLDVPETFLQNSLYTGLENLGLGGLADLGSFIPGLGGGNILAIAESFIADILNPVGVGGLVTFIGSLIPGLDASKITSGQFPLNMILGLLDGDGKILTSLLSVPVSVITGLTGAVQTVQQELVDLIVNALAGTPGHTGNPIEMVFTSLNGLTTALGAIDEVTDSLSFYVQDLGSMLVQIVQQASVRPVLGVIDQIMDAVSFWVFGWFHRTETAHTAQNAGIATLRGELNARLAEIGTGTTGWVDNFDAPGYSLATNYTVNTGEVTSVLGTRDGTNYVLQPPTSNRSTMYHNVEASTGQVDLEMAVSNLAQYGRCALWIGGHSASLAGGLDSGTLIVRIDNGFTNNAEQRLQIYTVSITGTQAAHGNLYTADMGTWHDGDLIRLRKDETGKLHRVFLNDVPVCEFDDSVTNVVTTGAGSRFGGWRQNLDNSSGPNVGPDLDLIHLYDWTV